MFNLNVIEMWRFNARMVISSTSPSWDPSIVGRQGSLSPTVVSTAVFSHKISSILPSSFFVFTTTSLSETVTCSFLNRPLGAVPSIIWFSFLDYSIRSTAKPFLLSLPYSDRLSLANFNIVSYCFTCDSFEVFSFLFIRKSRSGRLKLRTTLLILPLNYVIVILLFSLLRFWHCWSDDKLTLLTLFNLIYRSPMTFA